MKKGKTRPIITVSKNGVVLFEGNSTEVAKYTGLKKEYIMQGLSRNKGQYKYYGLFFKKYEVALEQIPGFVYKDCPSLAKIKPDKKPKEPKIKITPFQKYVNEMVHHFRLYGNYASVKNPERYRKAVAKYGYEFESRYVKCESTAAYKSKPFWVLTVTKGEIYGRDCRYFNIIDDNNTNNDNSNIIDINNSSN